MTAQQHDQPSTISKLQSSAIPVTSVPAPAFTSAEKTPLASPATTLHSQHSNLHSQHSDLHSQLSTLLQHNSLPVMQQDVSELETFALSLPPLNPGQANIPEPRLRKFPGACGSSAQPHRNSPGITNRGSYSKNSSSTPKIHQHASLGRGKDSGQGSNGGIQGSVHGDSGSSSMGLGQGRSSACNVGSPVASSKLDSPKLAGTGVCGLPRGLTLNTRYQSDIPSSESGNSHVSCSSEVSRQQSSIQGFISCSPPVIYF